MKKYASAAAAAALLSGGVVAFAGGTAVAGEAYPGSVETTCVGEALNNPRVGRDANVRFRVKTGGNGEARGKVTFTYQREKTGIIEKDFTYRYDGTGWEKYANSGLPKGHYNVEVFFNSTPGDSVYQNCRTTFDQNVRPKKR